METMREWIEDDQFEEGPMLTVYKEAFESRIFGWNRDTIPERVLNCCSRTQLPNIWKGRGFLLEERRRAQAYLHQSTKGKLVRKCRQVLVEKHLEIFLTGISRIYWTPTSVKIWVACISSYIESRMAWENLKNSWRHTFIIQGLLAIEKCGEAALNGFKNVCRDSVEYP